VFSNKIYWSSSDLVDHLSSLDRKERDRNRTVKIRSQFQYKLVLRSAIVVTIFYIILGVAFTFFLCVLCVCSMCCCVVTFWNIMCKRCTYK
jgi:hypothetical protein